MGTMGTNPGGRSTRRPGGRHLRHSTSLPVSPTAVTRRCRPGARRMCRSLSSLTPSTARSSNRYTHPPLRIRHCSPVPLGFCVHFSPWIGVSPCQNGFNVTFLFLCFFFSLAAATLKLSWCYLFQHSAHLLNSVSLSTSTLNHHRATMFVDILFEVFRVAVVFSKTENVTFSALQFYISVSLFLILVLKRISIISWVASEYLRF